MTNYQTKTIQITIIIKRRQFEYQLDPNRFTGSLITINSGEDLYFEILVNDSNTNNPLSGVDVNMTFQSTNYGFGYNSLGN